MTETTGGNRLGLSTFRAIVILAGFLAFLPGIRIFGRSYSMTRWPVTPGRVIASDTTASSRGRLEVSVDYEYILAGRVRRGHAALRTSSPAAADSVAAAFQAGREILVGYDPGNPDLSVLRPGIKWWSLVLTLAGAGLMAAGFLPRRPDMIRSVGSIALAFVFLATGCRQVPAPDGAGAAPSSDSVRNAMADTYRFLQTPGVSMEDVDSIWARLPYDSIYLRRDPCFGSCPMYDATFYRGGKARYHGIRFVDRVGDYQGEITLQDYGRLAYLLDRLEFMTLPDSFSVRYTDMPGAAMIVSRRPGGVKSVYDYGYVGPVELWAVREVFDAIANRIQWQKTGP